MLLDNFVIAGKDRFWDAPVKVVLAALLICLIAPIEINVTSTIPVTFQTLIILSLAMILGANKGALATTLYLLIGAVGLPVFADGGSGWEKLIGNTGGFLWAFVLAAWLVGRLAEGSWGRNWGKIAGAFLLGHLLILAIGFGWLGYLIGFEGMWGYIKPLLPGLVIKIVIGTLAIGVINAGMQALIRNKEHTTLPQ